MHIVKRILLGLFILGALTAIIVVLLRLYNSHLYERHANNALPAYLLRPLDMASYPSSVDGATVSRIDHGACQGFHLVPHAKTHRGVVVCFGGSEGSPNFQMAELLAKQGYETCALFMFGAKNQPATLRDVPLEQFADVLSYLDEQGVSGEPLTVFGASKGAEYALHLADKYSQITSVVLMAPSAYTFMGLDFSQAGSSWTWQGQELRYIDVQQSSLPAFLGNIVIPALIKAPISYRTSYDTAVQMDDARDEKLIPLQHSTAALLICAGTDDHMWPSDLMAKRIAERAPERTELHLYEGAGHIFAGDGLSSWGGSTVDLGGTPEANEAANKESQAAIMAFLERHHQ